MVCDDLFGKYSEFTPKFARKYANMQELITTSTQKYIEDIKNNNYPNENEVYKLAPQDAAELEKYTNKCLC